MGGSLSPAACCSSGSSCCTKGETVKTIKVSEVVSQSRGEGIAPMKAAHTETANRLDEDGADRTVADPHDREETYEDGSTYVGQVQSGKRHGHGVWTSPSEQYSGQWTRDQRDGQGRQAWSDGRLYEGQFADGKFHGQGRMEWHTPNGLMVYEGQYVTDVKHGHGVYKWPDGRCYDGQWVQGKRSGQATYLNLMGEVKRGIWKDDRIGKWLDDASQTQS